MNNKILVIAVHPDDETLGCGGTILRHKETDDEVHWCIVTAVSEKIGYSKKQVQKRENEIAEVALAYGFDGTERLDFPTMGLDTIPITKLIGGFSEIITKVEPGIIYLPFYGDVHSDHRMAFEAAFSCTKIFRYPFLKKILMIETLSETEFAPAVSSKTFLPNSFVDITPYIDRKMEIMSYYKGELDEHPFPRSNRNMKALATLRGATAGCEYAEAFMLLKEIV